MALIKSAFLFIRHHLRAKRWDSFHSPYLYKLFTYACDDKLLFPLFDPIEEQRHLFLKSNEGIILNDFGAGSYSHSSHSGISIGAIAKTALSLPFQCRFMARLARFTSPQTIIEFGSSLGIATSYLAAAVPTSKIITIEGDPEIAKKAQLLFDKMGIRNVTLFNETFEEFINEKLHASDSFDLIFIDGNHRKESLLGYYSALKSHINPNTIIIVDDIYWSGEMHVGWNDLTGRPEVTQSVDCFHFGLLFFKPDFLTKENHLVRLPLRSIRMR